VVTEGGAQSDWRSRASPIPNSAASIETRHRLRDRLSPAPVILLTAYVSAEVEGGVHRTRRRSAPAETAAARPSCRRGREAPAASAS
jgi:hypothetical protein